MGAVRLPITVAAAGFRLEVEAAERIDDERHILLRHKPAGKQKVPRRAESDLRRAFG